jgi:CO/xanthine dehydrogenase Mo-binding subunit
VSSVPRSPSLERNPGLDDWLRIEPDGTVTVLTGKVELGQGLRTAIARIAAEELDLELDQVRVRTADTSEGPDEWITAGSMSIEHSGGAVRLASAEARQVLLEAASARLGAPLQALEVTRGVVRVRGSERRVSYGELLGGRRFERRVTGEAQPKPAASYRIVGKPGVRIDLPEKVTRGGFVHDLALPGMLHGRVLRPPSYEAQLLSLDEAPARALPGVVALVRDGRFLGVVAEREEQAVRAREALASAAHWSEQAAFPADLDLSDWLAAQPCESHPVIDGVAVEGPLPPLVDPPGAALTLEASYFRPFVMHGAMGPSLAIAELREGWLTVHTHSQGVSLTRHALARVMDLPAERVRLIHGDGPGCYGHNCADDVVLDAALLARAVPGRPVRVQLTREEEHTWEPYGPAMRVDLRASLDAQGRLLAWSHEGRSNTHVGRPRPAEEGSQLAAAWLLERPIARPEPRARLGPEVGIHRNATPCYAIPRKRVIKHMVKTSPVRTSSLRGLGAFANVFAIESFMDELALASGQDPLEFRLRHLDDARAREVLETAAGRAGFREATPPGRGRGLAFARYTNAKAYTAIVVELEADSELERVRLRRVVIAADAGQIVDPSGLANQLEGGFLQAASWALHEQVRFDAHRITSRDWSTYPVLGFGEVPEIETVLLDRPGLAYLGAGEAAQGPTPAAIANAIFAGCGRRLRRTPFLRT